MKKILYLLLTVLLISGTSNFSQASLISDKNYRISQNKEIKQSQKQIRELIKNHNNYANKHDINSLKELYTDNYVNNDGFDKNVYFKSISETWETCEDLTYTSDIVSVLVNGDFASVQVRETATGTIKDKIDSVPISGEIHSKSTGIYHLTKINGKWFICGETSLSDESSLLYGDARFMNIEIQAPNQVFSGDTYTTTVKIDADEDTFVVGSIDRDLVTYPASTPKSALRAFPQSQVLERYLKANTQNANEYTVASLAISKTKPNGRSGIKIYMSGLACVMRRINVIPNNEMIKKVEVKK